MGRMVRNKKTRALRWGVSMHDPESNTRKTKSDVPLNWQSVKYINYGYCMQKISVPGIIKRNRSPTARRQRRLCRIALAIK